LNFLVMASLRTVPTMGLATRSTWHRLAVAPLPCRAGSGGPSPKRPVEAGTGRSQPVRQAVAWPAYAGLPTANVVRYRAGGQAHRPRPRRAETALAAAPPCCPRAAA
jgi:hypothetical protein